VSRCAWHRTPKSAQLLLDPLRVKIAAVKSQHHFCYLAVASTNQHRTYGFFCSLLTTNRPLLFDHNPMQAKPKEKAREASELYQALIFASN